MTAPLFSSYVAKIPAAQLQLKTPTAWQKELPFFHMPNLVANSGEKEEQKRKKKSNEKKEKKENKGKRMERTKRPGGVTLVRLRH